MEQYIPKSAIVAEIEKRIEICAKQREDMLNVQCHTLADDASARMGELNCIQDFLDTLEVIEVGVDFGVPKGDKSTFEVKEVNLEEKATQLSQKYFPDEENIWARPNIEAQRCKSACIEMVEWLKTQKGK